MTDTHTSPFCTVEEAVEEIRNGRMIIVVDDADRENEGDLTIAAEKITPDAINFMARHGRGLICLSMTPERLDELEIPLMVAQNTSRFETAFCVPIEAKGRTTTGISAADRATTVLTALDPSTRPTDFGEFDIHVFQNQLDSQEHVALVRGEIGDGKDILVRVHSSCLTGDVLH